MAATCSPCTSYVSKGTREIQYFWAGIPHEVFGADGKMVRAVTESGRNVIIPVPEGMDGKTWAFQHLVLGRLWFFNLPNYLAASPDALLIPREVAAKDGLNLSK